MKKEQEINQNQEVQQGISRPQKTKKFSTRMWRILAVFLFLAIVCGLAFYVITNREEPVSVDQLSIVIDPGHGSDQSPGAVYEGVFERDVNWQIAIKVKEKLEDYGITVSLTRGNDNIMVTPEERADFANKMDADLFVSIHQNAVETVETAQGIETWYSPQNHKKSKRLAEAIQQSVIDRTQANDRGTKEDTGLVVTNRTKMPSCLIETGFLTNAEERQKLTEEQYQEQLAQGIVDGIINYFGI